MSVSIRPSVREGAASLGRVVDQATAESLWNVYKQRKPTDGSHSSFVFIFHFHDLGSRATLPRKQEERLTLLWSFCWESPPSSRSSPPSPDATFLWMWAFCSRKATICRRGNAGMKSHSVNSSTMFVLSRRRRGNYSFFFPSQEFTGRDSTGADHCNHKRLRPST